ncbi:hypothetical protein Clacol_000963 [Clathrus columnatus]|uniref:Oligopeptide transporter n=1 Tax=Clathrus columnatus TaxID=1419009 RepID=A0AAV4ZXF9_9AGAM|nr:hypothetical protein Clacol_000963 [Clathrus columnatus]
MTRRNELQTADANNVVYSNEADLETLPNMAQPQGSSASSVDEKEDYDKLGKLESTLGPDVTLTAEDKLYDSNGKEKVLETAEDFATALVSLEDDPTLPIHTFRMWFSGLGLAVFGAVLAMLFQFRPQVITVSPLFLQLLVYMFGKAFEFVIPGPGSRWHNNNWFWRFMNPGPFNIKEHAAAQIMANTAAGAATACFVFASDDLFYGITVSYIAPLLGSFNIVCLAARHSVWVTYIFGGADGNEGMGLLGFGLDWANITSAPFYQPLATQISESHSLPRLGHELYHSTLGFRSERLALQELSFHQSKPVLDQSLNHTALAIFGAPWQSGSSVIFNLGLNLAIGATFVHIGLWHGKEIYSAFISYFQGHLVDDPHYQKMKVYKEVPMWWYGIVALSAFIVAMVCIHTEKSQLPWWALIVALFFAVLVLPFYGAMIAICSTAPGFDQLFQMLGSAVIPGSSQANMYFQLYSSVSLGQAQFMLSDLKLGQYIKLPPRATFTVQMVGTVVGALLNYVIMQVVVNNERPILLDNEGTRVWSGQQVQSYNANAILWGALGKEIYGPHGPYFIVPLGIVIGLALPVIPWLLYRKYGWRWLPYLNTSLIAVNIGDLAGGTNGYINTWMAIGLISHFYIRKYHAGWFRKYNYLLGAAIDGGAQIFVFVFSFALAGAGGKEVDFPIWALNPDGNSDYCAVTGSE